LVTHIQRVSCRTLKIYQSSSQPQGLVLGSNRLRHTKTIYTMAQDEKIFAEGFSFKRNEKAPDFVVGRLSLKVDDAIAFIRDHQKNGWVNLNIKTARSGNHYVELDTYEPTTQHGASQSAPKPKAKVVVAEDDGDLPF
jgi:hypothetical protein